jgi:hypothetical protein
VAGLVALSGAAVMVLGSGLKRPVI